MKDNIRRDRQLLKAFLLLLLLSTSVFLFMGSDEMSAKYVGKFFSGYFLVLLYCFFFYLLPTFIKCVNGVILMQLLLG
jgi:hypothetical protein